MQCPCFLHDGCLKQMSCPAIATRKTLWTFSRFVLTAVKVSDCSSQAALILQRRNVLSVCYFHLKMVYSCFLHYHSELSWILAVVSHGWEIFGKLLLGILASLHLSWSPGNSVTSHIGNSFLYIFFVWCGDIFIVISVLMIFFSFCKRIA